MKKIKILFISFLLASSAGAASDAQAGFKGFVKGFVYAVRSAKSLGAVSPMNSYQKMVFSNHSPVLIDDATTVTVVSKNLGVGRNTHVFHETEKSNLYKNARLAAKAPGMNMCPESYKPNPLDDDFHQRPSENPC